MPPAPMEPVLSRAIAISMLRVEKVVDATTETLLGINLPMNISGTLAVARASVRMKLAPTVCSTFLSIRVIWAF